MQSEASAESTRFEVVRRLAAGGMGEVLLGRQRMNGGLSRTVVLKTMLPHVAGSRANVELFLREARLASSLSHPNIVQILDVTEYRGSPCIVMEYLRGADLGAILRRASQHGGWPSVATTVAIVAQAADGLHHAHAHVGDDDVPRSIVHRDVSPQNLFVTRDGVVKVVDFGIARSMNDPRTQTGVLRGKIAYMAPEQLDGTPGAKIGPAVDQFALGVVLWECLAKRRLYQRPSPIETMKAVVSMPVPGPSALSGTPPAFDPIVLRALARRPADRFASCADLALALRTAARGLASSSETELVRAIVAQALPDPAPTPASAPRLAIDQSGPTPLAVGLAPDAEAPATGAAPPEDVLGARDDDEESDETWLDTYAPPSTASEVQLLAPPAPAGRSTRVLGAVSIVAIVAVLGLGLGWRALATAGTDTTATAPGASVVPVVTSTPVAAPAPSELSSPTPPPAPAPIVVRFSGVPVGARLEIDGVPSPDAVFRGPASETPHHVRVFDGDRVVWSDDPTWTADETVTVAVRTSPPPATHAPHATESRPHGHGHDRPTGLVRDYPGE